MTLDFNADKNCLRFSSSCKKPNNITTLIVLISIVFKASIASALRICARSSEIYCLALSVADSEKSTDNLYHIDPKL